MRKNNKNNKVKVVELVNGNKVKVKERKRSTNERYTFILLDKDNNELLTTTCHVKDYNKVMNELENYKKPEEKIEPPKVTINRNCRKVHFAEPIPYVELPEEKVENEKKPIADLITCEPIAEEELEEHELIIPKRDKTELEKLEEAEVIEATTGTYNFGAYDVDNVDYIEPEEEKETLLAKTKKVVKKVVDVVIGVVTAPFKAAKKLFNKVFNR